MPVESDRSNPLRAFPLRFLPWVALGWGCSVPPTEYAADASTGTSTHAFVSITRSASTGDTRAEAFAGVVRTPPEVDAASIVRLVGLGSDMPNPGQCGEPRRREEQILNPRTRVELLDVGDIELRAESSSVMLAARAFPAVTDLISGVVYTTRDRSAELPAGVRYVVRASGHANLSPAPFFFTAEAPQTLEQVTVEGLNLESVASLRPGHGLEVRWSPGTPGDRVYALLSSEDRTLIQCSYRDEDGRGAVSPIVIPTGTRINLSLHRVRVVSFNRTGVDTGEIEFTDQQTTSATVTE